MLHTFSFIRPSCICFKAIFIFLNLVIVCKHQSNMALIMPNLHQHALCTFSKYSRYSSQTIIIQSQGFLLFYMLSAIMTSQNTNSSAIWSGAPLLYLVTLMFILWATNDNLPHVSYKYKGKLCTFSEFEIHAFTKMNRFLDFPLLY